MGNLMANKIALVTGANKGIGFAICQGLLAAGFEVILTARSRSVSGGDSLDRGKEAAKKLSSDKVRVVELEVTDDKSIERAIEQLSKEIGHIDVLINNAGIYPDEGVNILTISRELLDLTMDTNAFSPIRITQVFLPLLNKAPAAKVINVSSGYGEINGLSANVPSYCLSNCFIYFFHFC